MGRLSANGPKVTAYIKASTQYDDFVGTAAADISDSIHLEDYLSANGVDTEKYQVIGIEFYANYAEFISVRFICEEKESQEIKTIGFEKNITKDDFFNLFKRFNVIVTKKHIDIDGREMDNTIMIDNR